MRKNESNEIIRETEKIKESLKRNNIFKSVDNRTSIHEIETLNLKKMVMSPTKDQKILGAIDDFKNLALQNSFDNDRNYPKASYNIVQHRQNFHLN